MSPTPSLSSSLSSVSSPLSPTYSSTFSPSPPPERNVPENTRNGNINAVSQPGAGAATTSTNAGVTTNINPTPVSAAALVRQESIVPLPVPTTLASHTSGPRLLREVSRPASRSRSSRGSQGARGSRNSRGSRSSRSTSTRSSRAPSLIRQLSRRHVPRSMSLEVNVNFDMRADADSESNLILEVDADVDTEVNVRPNEEASDGEEIEIDELYEEIESLNREREAQVAHRATPNHPPSPVPMNAVAGPSTISPIAPPAPEETNSIENSRTTRSKKRTRSDVEILDGDEDAAKTSLSPRSTKQRRYSIHDEMPSSSPTTGAGPSSVVEIMSSPPKARNNNSAGRSGVQQGGASSSRVTLDKTTVPGRKERRVASTSTLPLASSSKGTANFKSDANVEPIYSCPICFCPPTNATVTMCGHIACGECLFKSVWASMRRSGDLRQRLMPR